MGDGGQRTMVKIVSSGAATGKRMTPTDAFQDTCVDDLPVEVLKLIFMKLPIKCMVRCRLVKRGWATLIQSVEGCSPDESPWVFAVVKDSEALFKLVGNNGSEWCNMQFHPEQGRGIELMGGGRGWLAMVEWSLDLETQPGPYPRKLFLYNPFFRVLKVVDTLYGSAWKVMGITRSMIVVLFEDLSVRKYHILEDGVQIEQGAPVPGSVETTPLQAVSQEPAVVLGEDYDQLYFYYWSQNLWTRVTIAVPEQLEMLLRDLQCVVQVFRGRTTMLCLLNGSATIYQLAMDDINHFNGVHWFAYPLTESPDHVAIFMDAEERGFWFVARPDYMVFWDMNGVTYHDMYHEAECSFRGMTSLTL